VEIETFQSILAQKPQAIVLFVILATLRPLGMMYGFVLFSWGLGQSAMIRISIAFTFGITAFMNIPEQFLLVLETAGRLDLVFIAVVEFAIGYGFGLMTSLPILSVKYAGSITDTYRGEASPSLQDPAGGELQTYSLLYLIISGFIFFEADGLWAMVENMYRTYRIWPMGMLGFEFPADAWVSVVVIVQSSLKIALAVAAPLLIIFFTIDFALAVAAKLAPRFNLYDNSFLLKNVAAVAVLPLLVVYMARVSDANLDYVSSAIPLLEYLFK
jgi:type III secretory pathway component EscT